MQVPIITLLTLATVVAFGFMMGQTGQSAKMLRPMILFTTTPRWPFSMTNSMQGPERLGKIRVFDGTSWSEAFNTDQVSVASLASYGGKLYAGTVNDGIVYVYDGIFGRQVLYRVSRRL